MAARTHKGVISLPDSWKEKIKVSMIMDRLLKCIDGEVELSAQQINAAKIVLSKVVPDLARSELTGKDGKDLTLSSLVEASIQGRVEPK